MNENRPEPWLRGPLADVHPLVMPVFFSFAQVREDLRKYIAGLTSEQVWRQVDGASLGFHLRHIAGSVDRLTTYLLGETLSEQQLHQLRAEPSGNAAASTLLEEVSQSLRRSEEKLRQI